MPHKQIKVKASLGPVLNVVRYVSCPDCHTKYKFGGSLLAADGHSSILCNNMSLKKPLIQCSAELANIYPIAGGLFRALPKETSAFLKIADLLSIIWKMQEFRDAMFCACEDYPGSFFKTNFFRNLQLNFPELTADFSTVYVALYADYYALHVNGRDAKAGQAGSVFLSILNLPPGMRLSSKYLLQLVTVTGLAGYYYWFFCIFSQFYT